MGQPLFKLKSQAGNMTGSSQSGDKVAETFWQEEHQGH